MIEIIKKKLISSNYSSSVTLPIKWLKHNNLGKGDEIILEVTNDNIIIKPIK